MKKLSKMIIIALGVVLFTSGIASAKIAIIAKTPPVITTEK